MLDPIRYEALDANAGDDEMSTRPVELVDATRERCVLVEVTGANGGRPHAIHVTSATVGRSQTCDVMVDDETLSRVHARIVRIGDDFTLEDAGSRNGCFVNGARVTNAKLHSGDRIRLGVSALFRFELVSEDEERALARQYESGTRDALTGLSNRKLLDERLRAEIAYATRHGSELTVAMIDIDHFKRVNDTHGHLGGDAVLRAVANTIVASVRAEDMVARYGGEEIAVLVRGSATDGVAHMAERIRDQIERLVVEHDGRTVRVTASIGVASLGQCAPATAIALLGRADERLYRAKHEGRNRVFGEDVE